MATIIRQIHALHPLVQRQFEELAFALKADFKAKRTLTDFRVFETYRTPMRQLEILTLTKNTKAGPYRSAHQYGLAADFVPFTSFWSWDAEHDYAHLAKRALDFGLKVPYAGWDKVHVEHPDFEVIRGFVDRELKEAAQASKGTGAGKV